MKLFAVSDTICIFAVTKCPFGQLSQYLIGILRLRTPFVRTAKGKGVYGRYHSVLSNFATLYQFPEDIATISVCVGVLYLIISLGVGCPRYLSTE